MAGTLRCGWGRDLPHSSLQTRHRTPPSFAIPISYEQLAVWNTCREARTGPRTGCGESCRWELRDFLDFTGADAGSANAETASRAIHQGAHRLQIQIPAPLGDVVGVTDAVAKLRLTTAHIANLCHKTEISCGY